MTKLFQLACLSSLLFGFHHPVAAHYLWLEATPETSKQASIVNIDIRVGDGWPGQPLANDLSQYEIFDVYQDGNSEYVSGERGRVPAGFIEDNGASFGVYYRSVSRSIVMGQDDLLRHLVNEGLQSAFELYDKSGRPNEIRETYTHHALLLSDQFLLPKDDSGINADLMLRPGFESTTIGDIQAFRFHLTFQGQPVKNAPVTLRCADRSLPDTRQYSASDGWVNFDQLCEGTSLLHTIHMQARDETATEWESHWLSLTLERRGLR